MGGGVPREKGVRFMSDWLRFVSLLDFGATYYTTQLMRCAIISLLLTGIVMLLRKTVFLEKTFFRGMLWLLFLLLPFLGRLRLFYENMAVWRATWWLTYGIMNWRWAGRIYMAGTIVSAICIFGRRLRFRRETDAMEKIFLNNMRICVADMNVTPFTAGLLRPVVVIPKVMAERYGREELWTVLQHERTHIRLGHLWFGFAWDILRCLLWVNPFLTVFQKQLRADMEDICDRVCIQNSGGTAHEYGLILLKTLKLLRFESEGTPPSVTYAGEREFADIKRRMEKIAEFRTYKKRRCKGMAVTVFLLMAAMLPVIQLHSYARYSENRDIMVGVYEGEPQIVSSDTQELSHMISFDDRYVYVEREKFEKFLEKNDLDGEIWIVFGGFYKLPGLGGAAEACIYENSSQDRIVQISYESIMDDWYLELMKVL